MKLKCPLSGVKFRVAGIDSLFTETLHPIFSAKADKAIGKLLPLATADKLTEEELHLFGCFLIRQLPIERWDAPLLEVAPLTYWSKFWATHLAKIASAVVRLNGKDIKRLPTFSFSTSGTLGLAPLGNISDWLKDLHSCISEYYAPISDEARSRNKAFRAELGEIQYTSEESCEALINKALRGSLLSPREKQKFPEIIANWAAKVGDFPTAHFQKEDGKKVTIQAYWKMIIHAAFSQDQLTYGIADLLTQGVTIEDLDELLEHCVANIPVGTIQASALFRELEKVKEVIDEFRPGLAGKSKTLGFSIEVLSSKEVSDILSEVSSLAAPVVSGDIDPLAPVRTDFPTLSAYVRAKARYHESKKEEQA